MVHVVGDGTVEVLELGKHLGHVLLQVVRARTGRDQAVWRHWVPCGVMIARLAMRAVQGRSAPVLNEGRARKVRTQPVVKVAYGAGECVGAPSGRLRGADPPRGPAVKGQRSLGATRRPEQSGGRAGVPWAVRASVYGQASIEVMHRRHTPLGL